MTATLTEESAAATAERFVIAEGYEPVRHREGEGNRGMPFLPTLILDISGTQMDRISAEHRPSVGDVVQARASTSVDQYFYETPNGVGSLIFDGSRVNHPVDTGALVGLTDGTVLRTTHVREASVTGEVVHSPTGITGTLTAGRWIELQPKPGTTGPDGSPLLTDTIDANRLSGEITLSGTVPLRPTPEDGQLYVLWDQGPFNEATEYRVSRWHEASKSFWGIYTIEHSRHGNRRYNLGAYSAAAREALGSQQFVAANDLAPVDQPEKEGHPALMESFTTRLAQLHTRREEYGDRLNELAEENSYCSEFETIVQGVGLPGRTKTRNNLRVELEVEVRLTDESPSSRVDALISDDSGAEALSLTTAEYNGNMRVTVTLDDVELTEDSDVDDVYDAVDRDDVEDAVENSLRGYNLSDLDGWTVLGWTVIE